MKELVHYLASQLVDHPEEVQVTEVAGKQMTVIELKVAKDDIGKIIGKQGRLANSLRVILNAATAKTNKHAILEIIE